MNNIEPHNKFQTDELSTMENYQQDLNSLKKNNSEAVEPEALMPHCDDNKGVVSSLQELINRLAGKPAKDSCV